MDESFRNNCAWLCEKTSVIGIVSFRATIIHVNGAVYGVAPYHLENCKDAEIYYYGINKGNCVVTKYDDLLSWKIAEINIIIFKLSEEMCNVFIAENITIPYDRSFVDISIDDVISTKFIDFNIAEGSCREINAIGKIDEIGFSRNVYAFLPHNPYYKLKFNNSDHDLIGLPIVMTTSKIVGFINHYDFKSNVFYAMPYIYIHRIISEINNGVEHTRSFRGFVGFPLNFDLIKIPKIIEMDPRKEKSLVISEDSKISFITKTRQSFHFKKNDVLLYIDDKGIDQDGTVFLPDAKFRLPIKLYFALKYKTGDFVEFQYNRGDESNLKVTLEMRSIRNMIKIPMFKRDSPYLNIDGNIFTYLTTKLLHFYKKKNVKLIGSLIDDYDKDPFIDVKFKNGQKKRIIILVVSNDQNLKLNTFDGQNIPDSIELYEVFNDNVFDLDDLKNEKEIIVRLFKKGHVIKLQPEKESK